MYKFDARLFAILSLAFIGATIIGTIAHEAGHYMVAQLLGYEASIHYAYTDFHGTRQFSDLDALLISLGGPVQTMLMGTIGLLVILFCRNQWRFFTVLKAGQWFWIFVALFWLRQTANLATSVPSWISNGRFSSYSDETHIAQYFGLPKPALVIATGLAGLCVLCYIVFWVIPKPQRLTFLLSGLTGGIAGYVFWIVLFGKYIMP